MLRPHDNDDWGDGDGCAGGDPLVAGEELVSELVRTQLSCQWRCHSSSSGGGGKPATLLPDISEEADLSLQSSLQLTED